jgi:hypothetical protein
MEIRAEPPVFPQSRVIAKCSRGMRLISAVRSAMLSPVANPKEKP